MNDYKELLYEIIFENKKIKTSSLDSKCYISLKSIRASIEPLVSLVTNNNEYEYNRLMETIPRFYQDNYRLKYEKILCEDYYGDTYTNEDNQIRKVMIPKEAEKIGETEGLLLSIHNHPSGTSFQSTNDVYNAIRINEKYSITVARDGIMIVKNDSFNQIPWYESVYPYADVSYPLMTMKIQEMEKYKKSVSEYTSGKITQMQHFKNQNKIIKEYMDENRENLMMAINRSYEEYNYPIRLYYVEVK
jgi:hypothetical protein